MRGFLIILTFLPLFSFSQREWNVNIGTEVSYFNMYEYKSDLSIGYNIGFNYNTFEISFGINEASISFGDKGIYNIKWPSINLKHHFAIWRRGHGFFLFNYQGRKYALNIGTPPLNSKYNTYGNEVNARSDNFHLGFGIEPILWRRLAFPITLAGGIVHQKGEELPLPSGWTRNYYAFDKWEFSPFVSVGIRLYLFKRDFYGTYSDSQFF